jgi:mannose/cellobiose epimerase-like protein (N-acyl-D-glucosamine 2-epimerase family)
MKTIKIILLYVVFFGCTASVYPQTPYQPTSPYILDPERAIDFIRGIAAFRMKSRDNTNGGFYSFITRQGYSANVNEKALCGQSRIAYAFTRAFMVTGEEQYLEQAHHALKFLYDHGWNNGWYFATDLAGNYINHWGHDNWWGFQQCYALVGIAAMVEATGGTMNWNDGSQSDKAWLMRGIASNYNNLWDANPATKGYYSYANRAWTSKWGKGFSSTVDGATTHGELMALMYPDSARHTQRFRDLADNIVEHLVGNMPAAAVGFPEIFNADWSIDYGNTNMDIGHGYKTAWVLQRAYLRNPDRPEYLAGAQALMEDLWDHGCYDSVYGAPYSYVNWQSGAITGANKDFWMTEQGVMSGLIGYYTAADQSRRDRYLRIADGSLNFFMNHIVDPVYGDAYAVVSRDGASVVDTAKGGEFTAGYHATELGYYTYLYSSLYYRKNPVTLYYYYPAAGEERTVKLTPLAIEDNVLKMTDVTLDGERYTDFDKDARTIRLAAGTGGKLKVTFGFQAARTFTITAAAGTGGSVSPAGEVTVSQGGSQTFSLSAAAGYRIAEVLVDGASAGAVSSYTFSNVTGNHTISAAFASAPSPLYKINCGGSASSPFGADQYYSGGTARTVTSTVSTAGVTNPAPQAVYQAERYGTSTYTFPNLTSGARYTVRLHFAELYWTASGKRKFNVAINGAAVLSNYDIYAATGARYKAVVREFDAIANASGQIVIKFTTVTDNATVEGIEIVSATPNAGPTIATPASVNPATVTGTTAALSVLGADDNGESNLIYTWAATGPAAVTFGANGSNAAKATTATFSKAGGYTFQVTVTDGGGMAATSSAAAAVDQTFTGIALSPASATVAVSGTQQFTATGLDQFGEAMGNQPTFVWSVSGAGSIGADGLYGAGTAAGSATVAVTAGGMSKTAGVTVTAAPQPTVYRINCGAGASSPFAADQYFSGGTARTVSSAVNTAGVTDPAPQAVYQSERYGTSTYTMPNLTAGASYRVRLHFAELYWTASGKRRFNVAINGTTVLSNFDVYAATGARYKAVVKEYAATANGSGRIVIKFTTVTDNATIEGIEVVNQ